MQFVCYCDFQEQKDTTHGFSWKDETLNKLSLCDIHGIEKMSCIGWCWLTV